MYAPTALFLSPFCLQGRRPTLCRGGISVGSYIVLLRLDPYISILYISILHSYLFVSHTCTHAFPLFPCFTYSPKRTAQLTFLSFYPGKAGRIYLCIPALRYAQAHSPIYIPSTLLTLCIRTSFLLSTLPDFRSVRKAHLVILSFCISGRSQICLLLCFRFIIYSLYIYVLVYTIK